MHHLNNLTIWKSIKVLNVKYYIGVKKIKHYMENIELKSVLRVKHTGIFGVVLNIREDKNCRFFLIKQNNGNTIEYPSAKLEQISNDAEILFRNSIKTSDEDFIEPKQKIFMPFGKHYGIEISKLPISYIAWAFENVKFKPSAGFIKKEFKRILDELTIN